MGVVAIIARVMPESPESDLEIIKDRAKESLEKEGAQNMSFEVKDMAFGLKAVFVKFAWPEEKGSDVVEDILGKIEGVSSVSIEDYRRAFG